MTACELIGWIYDKSVKISQPSKLGAAYRDLMEHWKNTRNFELLLHMKQGYPKRLRFLSRRNFKGWKSVSKGKYNKSFNKYPLMF